MSGDSSAQAKPKFACEVEAAKLLNCIASSQYVEQKCVAYLKALRKCVQREGVVGFNLLPDSEPAAHAAATSDPTKSQDVSSSTQGTEPRGGETSD